MQRLTHAHTIHTSIGKVNKRAGVNIRFPSTGYLLAVYLLTRNRPNTSAFHCYTYLVGKLIKKVTYDTLKVQLDKLVSAGLLQSELVTYKGRQVTRYSLTISGHNYLTELERLAKAAKFTLDS